MRAAAASTSASSTCAVRDEADLGALAVGEDAALPQARALISRGVVGKSVDEAVDDVRLHAGRRSTQRWCRSREPDGESLRKRMVAPRARIGVLECDDRGSGDEARLAHAAAQHLRGAARLRS